MKVINYHTTKGGICITTCDFEILVGSRFCMACRYCNNHDRENKTVECLKSNLKIKSIIK